LFLVTTDSFLPKFDDVTDSELERSQFALISVEAKMSMRTKPKIMKFYNDIQKWMQTQEDLSPTTDPAVLQTRIALPAQVSLDVSTESIAFRWSLTFGISLY